MSRSLPFLSLAAALAVAGCATDTTTTPPTADEAGPTTADTGPAGGLVAGDRADVLLENGVVRATRVEIAPGDSLAPHEGGTRVVYALTPYTVRFEQDGQVSDETFVAGSVHGHPAGRHGLVNTGTSPAEFVVFERLEGSASPTPAGDVPTAIPDPTGTTDDLVFNDDEAEVHRVTLQPGAALPPHRGYARVIYSLGGYSVEFKGESGTHDRSFTAGEAHYHDPGDHTVENTGDSVAEFLVVEFKR